MAKTYLDRETGLMKYIFVKSPMWYSVEVDPAPGIVKAAETVGHWQEQLNLYLASVYEAVRSGRTTLPEPSDEVKRIVELCQAPVGAPRGRKPKQQDTEVDSSTPLPKD